MAIDLTRFFDLDYQGTKEIHIGTDGSRRYYIGKNGRSSFLRIEYQGVEIDTFTTREDISREYEKALNLKSDSELQNMVNRVFFSINK